MIFQFLTFVQSRVVSAIGWRGSSPLLISSHCRMKANNLLSPGYLISHRLAAVYIMDRSTILARISLPLIELASAPLFARAIVVCRMSALTLVALSPASFTTFWRAIANLTSTLANISPPNLSSRLRGGGLS